MAKRGRPPGAKNKFQHGKYQTFLQRGELGEHVPPYRKLEGDEFEKRKAELEERERLKRHGSR